MATMLREAMPELPSVYEGVKALVSVLHPAANPGYPLFSFNGLDSPNGEVSWAMVHTACAIVTGNRFDGHLARSQSVDAEHVLPLPNGLMAPGVYFFHVPHGSNADDLSVPYHYPVVPNFRNWSFPTNLEPLEAWRDAEADTPSQLGKMECVVTRHQNGSDNAHIVPASESRWLAANQINMGLGGTLQLSDHADNKTVLRADLHRLWDNKKFHILPKPDRQGTMRLAFHCVERDPQLTHLYHNRPLPTWTGHDSWCPLFARFAWGLFPLRSFLVSRGPHLIQSYNFATASWEEQWVSDPNVIAGLLGHPRSTSPKRRRPNSPGGDSGLVQRCTLEGCECGPISAEWVDPSYYDGELESSDEEDRGRPLKRRRAHDFLTLVL